MPRRISWKKGMRLTDDILRTSDQCSIDLINNAFVLASAGRFGLIPSESPFDLSVDISKGVVDILSINCFAITRGGDLVELRYDTRYTNSFATRIEIPTDVNASELILTINVVPGQWVETNNGYEEPEYTFALVLPDSQIADNALPIARIVDSDFSGWRIDDVNFVPPCLFTSAHPKYQELLTNFKSKLNEVDLKIQSLLHSDAKNALRILWPIVQQLMITIDKESDIMAPMTLLSNVQKFVSAFTCACDLDDYLELEDADTFRNYVRKPYNYKDVYAVITEGLGLCYQICEKIDKITAAPAAAPPQPGIPSAPTIDDSQLIKKCSNTTAKVNITNNAPGATVYYTIDGSEPTESSKKGTSMRFESGFSTARTKEPDKVFTIKVKAILNGVSSKTNTYQLTLIKDIARWTGIEI